MTFNQRIEAGKPYLTGFVVGLIVAPIVAFSAGWVTTSGARATAVEDARIETLALVCSERAYGVLASESTNVDSFRGFDNRVARNELVARTMADMQVPEALVSRVTSGCSQNLA